MKNRARALGVALVVCLGAGMLGLSASASAASTVKKPSPSPSPSPAPSGTFVKAYAALVNGSQLNLSPLDVQSTSDGGYIALSETQSSQGLGVNWLVKLSATGAPQWQEQVGCASPQGAPGDYADGVSVQQTSDGGYVVGGGTIDCGSGTSCPALSGQSCALVEKLTPAGKLSWARAYKVGPDGSAITQIRQTADGGYVAVGSFQDASQNTGAVILKLDAAGTVQWQRDLGPAGATTQAYFNSVQQAADGGYVAAGVYYTHVSGLPDQQVLVAKFGGDGTLAWQHGFATTNGSGSGLSVIRTADSGYAVGANWHNATFNSGNGADGALLLKLDADGTLQWQKAYSGGVYCFFNGFSETCTDIGAVAYTAHQTSDGGYVLAGDSRLELTDSAPIEPWQAKVDAGGGLVWQHLYYQTYKPTGRPLGEFFPAAAPAPGGGFLAVGPTLDYPTQHDLLFAVRTDSSGLAGTCGDVHPATPLQAIDPQLAAAAPSLPLQTATTPPAASPIGTLATSISTQQDC
jgi:hypothetical protein